MRKQRGAWAALYSVYTVYTQSIHKTILHRTIHNIVYTKLYTLLYTALYYTEIYTILYTQNYTHHYTQHIVIYTLSASIMNTKLWGFSPLCSVGLWCTVLEDGAATQQPEVSHRATQYISHHHKPTHPTLYLPNISKTSTRFLRYLVLLDSLSPTSLNMSIPFPTHGIINTLKWCRLGFTRLVLINVEGWRDQDL